MQIQLIPIINYHKISPAYDIGITTRHPDKFKNDLNILKKYQFNTITFKDLVYSQSEISKPIIITFDDAYQNIREYALPIMKTFGFRGIIYPVTNFVGEYNSWDVQIGKFKFKHLSWTDLKEIQDSGFEIGSHTQSHELLTQMNYHHQFIELSESKKRLEEALGIEIYSISYPFGRFNQETIRCAAETGYKFGLASLYFKPIEEKKLNFALKRFNVYRFDTSEQFMKKIGVKNNNAIFFRDWLIQKGGLGTVLLQSIKKHLWYNGKIEIESK